MNMIDFLIIAPLAEEWRVVKDIVFKKSRPVENPDNPEYLITEKHGYTIAGTYINDMGISASAMHATKAIEYFRPVNIIVLGIAGGFTEECNPGTVVVPKWIECFEVGEIDIDKDTGELLYKFGRSTGSSVDDSLHSIVSNIRNDDNLYKKWIRKCKDSPQAKDCDSVMKSTPTPSILCSKNDHVVASGNFVVKHPKFKEKITGLHSKTCAVEMESSGVFKATEAMKKIGQAQPNILIIRGISDRADSKKNQLEKESKGTLRAFAIANTAILANAVLEKAKASYQSIGRPNYKLHELKLMEMKKILYKIRDTFFSEKKQNIVAQLESQVGFFPKSTLSVKDNNNEKSEIYLNIVNKDNLGFTELLPNSKEDFLFFEIPRLDPNLSDIYVRIRCTDKSMIEFSIEDDELKHEMKLYLEGDSNVI